MQKTERLSLHHGVFGGFGRRERLIRHQLEERIQRLLTCLGGGKRPFGYLDRRNLLVSNAAAHLDCRHPVEVE